VSTASPSSEKGSGAPQERPAWRGCLLRVGLNLLVLPLTVIWLVVALFPFSPMVFMADAEIRNSTDETLRVTPLGVHEGTATRERLWTYTGRWPHFPAGDCSDVELPPGARLQVTYDNDSMWLSDVVIERADGTRLVRSVLRVGPEGPEDLDAARRPVVLDRIDDLAAPDAAVLAALAAKRPWWRSLWVLFVACSLGPFVHVTSVIAAVRAWRRRRTERAVRAAA
jgi:hypothetical protein